MTLTQILTRHGFVPTRKAVKLVRHKDKRMDVEKLYRDGWLETYQRYQDAPVFDKCNQIVAFLGEKQLRARFVGVYDVEPRVSAIEHPLPTDWPHPEFASNWPYYYPLKRRAGFDDLREHLVIDWGKGARTWHQWFTDRPIVESPPTGVSNREHR